MDVGLEMQKSEAKAREHGICCWNAALSDSPTVQAKRLGCRGCWDSQKLENDAPEEARNQSQGGVRENARTSLFIRWWQNFNFLFRLNIQRKN